MALTDYTIDTSGSPQDVQRKQALAEALMKQGQDSTPAAGGKGGGWVTALNRGLAGALGGYQQGQARQEEQQGRDSVRQQLAAALQGNGGKIDPQTMIGLASNQWATPGQTQAVTHVADMQAQQARQAVEDKHWGATYQLQKEAAARAADKTPANFEANPDFGKAEGAPQYRPISGGPADPAYLTAATEAKQGSGMGDAAVEILARRLNTGDTSALQNVGRGAQSAKNIERIQNKAAEILQKEEGLNASDAAKHVSSNIQSFKASQVGQSAEARTGATREANLNLILKATDAAIPAALEASDKVARTGWVPVNKIIQGGEVVASNPELKRFGMANLQLAEHWARAMNPTGVMRESDRDKLLVS